MLLINPYRFAAPRFISNDADVVSYVLAVEAADGKRLEDGVISAYDSFITGCKSDGIWSAIKASCILAGARTLSGALVPLVGTAPTNFNFVTGDYNRKTGLKGNGSSKYLNSNRNNNADPQNNKHVAAFYTQTPTRTAERFSLGIITGSATTQLGSSSTALFLRVNGQASGITNSASITNLFGASRSNSSTQQYRFNGSSGSLSRVSETPPSLMLDIYRRGTTGNYFDGRMSFYSIGESLDLALLDTRVSTLMTDLAASNI